MAQNPLLNKEETYSCLVLAKFTNLFKKKKKRSHTKKPNFTHD